MAKKDPQTTPDSGNTISDSTDTSSVEIPGEVRAAMECYPTVAVFYLTTDGMLFLANEKTAAEAHQKRLKSGELKVYRR